jgi:hypothetical protein
MNNIVQGKLLNFLEEELNGLNERLDEMRWEIEEKNALEQALVLQRNFVEIQIGKVRNQPEATK